MTKEGGQSVYQNVQLFIRSYSRFSMKGSRESNWAAPSQGLDHWRHAPEFMAFY